MLRLPERIAPISELVDSTMLQPGKNYYPQLSDDLFADTDFPTCGITVDAAAVMGQPEAKK